MNTILILLSVLLNVSGQLMMRKGMLQIGEVGTSNLMESIGPMLANWWLWGAVSCYLASVLLWFIVLSRTEVSYAYMFNALGYVAVAVGGYCFFQENISPMRIVGILVICIGVIIMARG